jgi:high-affinity Fe2+/Pb2+ permease
MWDRKRQIIWLTVGLLFGTFSLYPIARDDAGRFDLQYFIQLETLLLIIICVMFFIYSRKKP